MNRIKNNLLQFSVLLSALLLTSGCGIYSFTGTSISPEIKTISIQNITNETGLGPSRLSQNITEKLKEYFLQNTNLKLVKSNGDLQLSGTITEYLISPVGAQQTTPDYQTGQANKLTITVKANFVNTFDETQNYDKSFSFYQAITTGASISPALENQKVDEITEQLIFSIFNASVSNW